MARPHSPPLRVPKDPPTSALRHSCPARHRRSAGRSRDVCWLAGLIARGLTRGARSRLWCRTGVIVRAWAKVARLSRFSEPPHHFSSGRCPDLVCVCHQTWPIRSPVVTRVPWPSVASCFRIPVVTHAPGRPAASYFRKREETNDWSRPEPTFFPGQEETPRSGSWTKGSFRHCDAHTPGPT